MQIFSFSPFGYEGSLVTVEVDLRRGIPAIDIVGLADGAVRESRERMRSAIQNSGFVFPSERVLISLSPADLRKEGAGFDLAIALAVLEAQKFSENKQPLKKYTKDFYTETTVSSGTSYGYSGSGDTVLVMGELELSGNVRTVRGVHAAASTAAASGCILRCIVPAANAEEAREVTGMKVYGVETLAAAFKALSHPEFFTSRGKNRQTAFIPSGCTEIDDVLFPPVGLGNEFSEVIGQQSLIRGLQVAAAGGHNLLAVGAPGCGKTMALQKFPALLPLLTIEEAQPVTRIYSLAGFLSPQEPLMRIAPFRMPHQTASIEGMCGGGVHCMPGEISLAHNGVLFLDEAAEFRQSVVQMLRVPLESGRVTLVRAGRATVYPAVFQLLLAANPCPCGNYGSKTKVCLCSARAIELYWKKISGPLLDRIDIRIPVENEFAAEVVSDASGVKKTANTTELRGPVAHAVKIQRQRQNCRNARLVPQQVADLCCTTTEARKILDSAIRRNCFSPRAATSCLKIARTIADMEGKQLIDETHMYEAVRYRQLCGGIPEET
jgi:magnesium chelatase family protein